MFQLAPPDQTYRRQVQIQQPQADGGTRAVSFTAHFRLLDNDDLNKILTPDTRDEVFLGAVMAGWEDIQDEKGDPLPFTPQNLRRLCRIGYWAHGVVNDYLAFQRGEPAKN